jgi:hypothetical protein
MRMDDLLKGQLQKDINALTTSVIVNILPRITDIALHRMNEETIEMKGIYKVEQEGRLG